MVQIVIGKSHILRTAAAAHGLELECEMAPGGIHSILQIGLLGSKGLIILGTTRGPTKGYT